jgi:signal transduction histidine kinase
MGEKTGIAVKMVNKKTYNLAAIVAFVVFITSLHLLILQKQSPDVVLEEFYYIPILFGALFFGLKGALLIYLFASLSYLPFFFGGWTATFLDLMDRLLHLLFTGIFAFLAGFFVDREKKRQKELDKERYLASIGQVATTIVHDLKNPLITILWSAKRIQEGKGNIDTTTQAITDSVQHMQRIVNDVLDFSKPLQLALKEEDLRNVIKQISDSCGTKTEERGVPFLVDIPDHPLNVVIDSFNMHRALTNLINNAIEASDTGQEVKVTAETKKNYLHIIIKDHGSGMDKETLENIFTPFYTKKSGGTGLGMSIAKKIIDGHKGKIRIDSKPGAGTEVIIELPYRKRIEK